MKISIIIPCYNAEHFIKDCLVSCINQDYENIEILFVDNEGIDKSLEVVEKIKEEQPTRFSIDSAPNKFKYSWEEPVLKALEYVTGDYFTIVGADDVLHPTYISNVVKELKEKGTPPCVQSAIVRFLPNGSAYNEVYNYNSLDEMKSMLLKSCCVLTPTVFYKKELYDNGFIDWKSSEFLGAGDYNLYCSLAENNIYITPLNKFLGYYYRVHKDQSTWGMVEEAKSGNVIDKKIQSYWKKRWIR